MKYIILTFAILFLASCSINGGDAETSEKELNIRCINGVSYYLFVEKNMILEQGYGFMAPKYNRDGTISLCEGDNNERY